MKRHFYKLVASISMLVFSAFANAGYINVSSWGINVNGSGTVSDMSTITALSVLTISGTTAIDSTGSTFTDTGYYSSATYTDAEGISTTNLLGATLTGIFSGSGNYIGTETITGNTIYSFTSGAFDIYVATISDYVDSLDDDTITLTSILSATVTGGTGTVDLDDPEDGDATPAINVVFNIASVAEGYFFVEVDDVWYDLYDLITDDTFGVSFAIVTNTITTSVPSTVSNYLDALTSGSYSSEQGENDLTTESTGSFGLSAINRIPEPATLGLMGFAFLGLAGFQQRRKNS